MIRIGSPAPLPPTPPKPQHAPARPEINACPPMKADSVRAHGAPGVLADITGFVKGNWTSFAGLTHGLVTTPGEVAHELLEDAEHDEHLAEKIEGVFKDVSAASRQQAIDELGSAAEKYGSKELVAFSKELDAANALPRLLESFRADLHGAPAEFDGVKASLLRVQQQIEDIRFGGKEDVADLFKQGLKDGSDADKALAAGAFKTLSRWLALDPGTIADKLHLDDASDFLDTFKFLRDTPVIGLALAGIGTAADAKRVGLPDSIAANFGSTFAGTAIGSATADGLTAAAADFLAVDAATGPAGWAVGAGVIVAAAAGYGIYRAVESKAGQDIIDGYADGNYRQMFRGFGEGATDIVHIDEKLGNLADRGLYDLGSGVVKLDEDELHVGADVVRSVGHAITHPVSTIEHLLGI